MTKALYQVYDTQKKQYVAGTSCDSKLTAKKFRRELNQEDDKDTQKLRYIVALGEDHWRYKPKQ